MKQIRTIGLCLVAVVAFGAIVAASASANPEFEPASGKYTGVQSGLLNPRLLTEKSIVECTGDTSSGEITGAMTTGKNSVKFTGCKSSGFACTSAKQASETIVTSELSGTLGYVLPNTGKVVAMDLKPTKAGAALAEFTCAGIIKVTVTGDVAGVITPTNGTPGKVFTLTYNVTEVGGKMVQEVTEWEALGGVKEKPSLMSFGEPSWQMSQDTLTLSEGKTGIIKA